MLKHLKIKEEPLLMVVGFSYVLIGFLGMTTWTFSGRLIANVFRFFVGNTYPFLALICLIYGLLLLFLKKELKFKRPAFFWSLLWLYSSVLCLVTLIWQPTNLADGGNVLLQILKNSYHAIQMNSLSFSVGGGVIGGLLYQGGWLLAKKMGVVLVILLTAALGAITLGRKKKR